MSISVCDTGKQSPSGERPVDFSVIIPTYNRPKQLNACLSSVLDLHKPSGNFEVIVVDDGGRFPLDDQALSWCQQFAQRQITLRLVRQSNAGPAAARNHGARLAHGRWLAFTDDDCRVKAEWLVALERAFQRHPEHLLGGRIINGLERNRYACASHALLDYLYAARLRQEFSWPFFGCANLAVNATAFANLGGFDTHYTLAAAEDREFCDRWLHQGGQLSFIPDAQIEHFHQMGLREFWRQHFQYGRGAHQFHRALAQRQGRPLTIEHPSFYLRLLFFPLLKGVSLRNLQISTLLLLSQLAALTGFLAEARTRAIPSASSQPLGNG